MVSYRRVDFDTAVHRAWVHDQCVIRQQLGSLFVEPESIAVFADAGNERFGHAFTLHAEQVTDIDRWQHRVDVGTDLDGPTFEAGRQQCWWRNERDIGTERSKSGNVAASDAGVSNIADDRDSLSGDITEALTNCVAIEQCLGGMFVPSVASIDHCAGRPLSYLARDARRCVTNNDRVDAHRFDGFDGVAKRFALLD